MQSITYITDLWYPDLGSETMKRLWWSVAICLAVALAVPLAWEGFPSRSAGGKAVREITEVRFIQPRLSVERVYARCEPRAEANRTVSNVWCSTTGAGQDLRPAVSKAARNAGEGLSRGASHPAELHLDGVAQLISSRDGESLDQAIRQLESGARRQPPDASALNDLATAYFVRGQQNENLHDLVLALSMVDRAVQADGRLPAALFNRALFLQEMSLSTEARLAWRRYLQVEKEPGWSAEARARLQRLERISADELWNQQRQLLDEAALRGDASAVEEIVTRFRQPSQKYAAEQVLGQWGEALLAKDRDRADRFLSIARTIGESLRRSGGDEMIADAVATIDESRTEPAGSSRLHDLAEGHSAYLHGMTPLNEQKIEEARPRLETAERALRDTRSPFLSWARLQLEACDYYNHRYAEVRRALEEIDQSLPDDRYPSLRGRLHFILGSMDILQGRPGDSLQRFQRARELFAKARETENLATIDQHFAISFGALGSKELWRPLYRALRIVEEIPSHRRVFGILDEAGIAALSAGQPQVALSFQNELLERARGWKDADDIASALRRRADTLAASRRPLEALGDLAAASEAAEKITDPSLRAEMKAYLALSAGQIGLDVQPDLAVADLTEAVRSFRAMANRSALSLALFLRARAYLATGDNGRAREDFAAGLREIERTRENLTDETLRIAFADQATQAFDEILAFESGETGGEATAFQLAEQARGRELLENLAVSQFAGEGSRSTGPQLLTVAELRSALPERTLVVKYAVLPDKLLLWTLTRRELQLRTIPLGMQDLDRKVRRLLAGMQNGQGASAQALLRELYALLISPVEQDLQSVRDLVVVPDKSLHLLPFSALVDPRTNHYLIEDHGVVMAPSANIYVHCLSQRVSQSRTPPANALLVGDPSFDAKEFPTLDRLPDAATEVKAIAMMYPAKALLVDREATKWNVLHQIARGPEVIQISAHALESSEHSEYSRLLLAQDPPRKDSGALYLHEVRNLHFKGTRLVVLAGCGTAAGPLSASEGYLSLARAFLASGVPAVVATRWNIDDATSRQLVTEFHRLLRSGEDPVTALRRSQLAQAKDQENYARHSWNWASFQLIGGINSTEKGDR